VATRICVDSMNSPLTVLQEMHVFIRASILMASGYTRTLPEVDYYIQFRQVNRPKLLLDHGVWIILAPLTLSTQDVSYHTMHFCMYSDTELNYTN